MSSKEKTDRSFIAYFSNYQDVFEPHILRKEPVTKSLSLRGIEAYGRFKLALQTGQERYCQ